MENKTEKYEFITEYWSEGKLHGSSIFAKNREEVEKQLDYKRKTERIVGQDTTKVYLFD